jgi:hypothetical protein
MYRCVLKFEEMFVLADWCKKNKKLFDAFTIPEVYECARKEVEFTFTESNFKRAMRAVGLVKTRGKRKKVEEKRLENGELVFQCLRELYHTLKIDPPEQLMEN